MHNASAHMPRSSRLMFYFSGLYLPIGAHVMDYSRTHILNPNWPPHAKFHDGQTMSFSILLGLLMIYFSSRKTTDRVTTALAVAAFSELYWITQIGAIFYPGTAFTDPEFGGPAEYLFGVIPGQIIPITIGTILTIVATWLALRKNARWT